MAYEEFKGNLHVHSTYSDGRATIEEIAAAAARAGLDFVGINDHLHLRGLREGKEGFRGGVAVLIGCELNHLHNHYLAYGISEEIPSDTEDPQKVIDATARQNGIGFIAHPFEIGSPLHEGGHTYTWERWDVTDFTGISIWNFSSIWLGNAQTVPAGLYYYHNMRAANLDPLEETIAKWDELTRLRPVVAIGGSDNHGIEIRKLGGLIRGTIFDYEYAFRAVNTHVLLPVDRSTDFDGTRRAIYEALRLGRCFVACGLFADPRGFRFWAETAGGEIPMGGQASLEDSPVFTVKSPARGLIRFIHEGREIESRMGTEASLRAEKAGPYRAEVRLPRAFGRTRAWIFSNPIYLR
jgi:hypothetical protein